MSMTDPGVSGLIPESLENGGGLAQAADGAPAGAPDAAVLTRLANELFAATPGVGTAPSVVPASAASGGAGIPPWLSAPAPESFLPRTSPLPVPPPDESDLRAILSPALAPATVAGNGARPVGEKGGPPPAPPGRSGISPTDSGISSGGSRIPPWLSAAAPEPFIPRLSPLPGEGELRAALSSAEAFTAAPGEGIAPTVAPAAPPAAPRAAAARAFTLPTLPLSSPLPGEMEIRPALPSALEAAKSAAGGAEPTVAGAVASPSGLSAATLESFIPRTLSLPVPLPYESELRAILSPALAPATVAGNGATPVGEKGGPPPAPPGEPAYYFLNGTREPQREPAGYGAGWGSVHPEYDVLAVRRDFPILQETVNGKPLVWLDNGATTQKPQAVIDRITHYYRRENSNIHRAAHALAARATDAFESARDKTARFLNASSSEEIVFVRGATEAINLVAQSWGRQNLVPGDEILITWLEHHANIVPWQYICAQTGAVLKVAPVDDHGQVLLDHYEGLMGPRTRLVAFTEVSNALGTVNPVKPMVEMAHRYGARVLVDGAQAVAHRRVDMQALDVDWYVFSGHKIFAPTGIGVLYGKRELLKSMPPWQGGGNMITDVTFEKTEYQHPPTRFEAGTASIADAVGLGAAIDYVQKIGVENVTRHERQLMAYATKLLGEIPGLRIIGTAVEKAAVISFVLDGARSEDIGAALNRDGIAVRAGHHCAQPILRRFGLEATVRPSFALYNTFADVDALVASLRRIQSGINPVRG